MGLMGLSACFTGSSSDMNHEIVSKSKESEPIWTKQRHETLVRNNNGFEYVLKVADVTNLALGIKTTQLQAIDNSRSALAETLRIEVTKDLSSSSAKSLKQNQQFSDALNDVVKRRHADLAKISDIYFEQYIDNGREDGNQALYKVYVLVGLPGDLLPQLARDLAVRIRDLSDPAVRAVSTSIQTRWQPAAGS